MRVRVYYRRLVAPVANAEIEQANRANALHDAHREVPEFGDSCLHEEAAEAGQTMAARTARRTCSDNQWWSAFAKLRGKNGKRPGPPMHDDLVRQTPWPAFRRPAGNRRHCDCDCSPSPDTW